MRLLGAWLLAAAALLAFARDCERLKVPFCEKMPYDETRLPNLFGHETQQEVNLALEKLQDLQDSGCFGHYTFLLCTAFAPPCISDVERPAPCQRVCERARDRCYGLMLMFNVTEAWPDCDVLPKHGTDPLCLQPTSLDPRDSCHCLKKNMPKEPTKKLLNRKDYDYAMKARMEGFAPSHFPSIPRVTVLDIFREGIVELPKNNITFIRTNTSCKCPELELGKEYLIMGYEDFNRSELLLGKDSYVKPWSNSVENGFGEPVRKEYRNTETRHYSSRYRNYVDHHGYHLGFHRPSFSTLLMAGGAYGLYRHYKNKKKLGKVYGYPGYGGYGGYGSSFGALGGGGFGSLGNPRGRFTNFANPAAAPGFGGGRPGYSGYSGYNGYGYGGGGGYGRPGGQVPSYPITHKPNYATSKPNFINRNPSYPVTSKPYRTSSGSRSSTSSRSNKRRFGIRRSSTSSSSSRSRYGGSRSRFGGRRKG